MAIRSAADSAFGARTATSLCAAARGAAGARAGFWAITNVILCYALPPRLPLRFWRRSRPPC